MLQLPRLVKYMKCERIRRKRPASGSVRKYLKTRLTGAVAASALALLAVLIMFSLPHTAKTAYAAGSAVLESATCLDYDKNTVTYDVSQPKYARNITLTYSTPAQYYSVQVSNVFTGALLENFNGSMPAGQSSFSFTVKSSGYLKVSVYSCDDNWNIIVASKTETYIRSDNLAPSAPSINEMTSWVRHFSGFLTKVTVGTDEHSGVKEAVIIVKNIITKAEETIKLTEMGTGLTTAFTLNEKTEVTVFTYDNAGNVAENKYVYDKFDSDKPSVPVIVCTPSPAFGEDTNNFTREYNVTLEYGTDSASGVNYGSMKYLVNGELYNYNGGFVLDKAIKYTITAYYTDNAGNVSDSASVTVENIDRFEPFISFTEFKVDLTKEKPYTVTINCVDLHSGIKSVSMEGITGQFVYQAGGFYQAGFTDLDSGSIKITVTDKVGNFISTFIPVYHFSDLYLSPKISAYHEKYINLNVSLYSDEALEKISKLYGELNILLMAESSSKEDFNAVFSKIDAAVEGKTVTSFKIDSVPAGLNVNISYILPDGALNNAKKGDSFTLWIGAVPAEALSGYISAASAASGFSESVVRPFLLRFTHNGENIAYALNAPVVLTVPVPSGYEARYIKAVNLTDNSVIPAEVINNTVTFPVSTAGAYALVFDGKEISGNTDEEEKPKGIKVFGKYISVGAFCGSLAGAVVLLGGGVALILVLQKKRGMGSNAGSEPPV